MKLKEYVEGIENIKEKSEDNRKIFRAFDENDNLLYHDVGSFGGGTYWNNCIFHCSKCLRQYFSRGHMKRHALKCNGLFNDGFHKITKYPLKEVEKFINCFSRMSKITQGIDFSMSSEDAIRKADKTVLFLVRDRKPIRYITFCKRKFSEGEKISLEDFFVVEYLRKNGFGNLLFEALLKEINLSKKEDVENNLVVNKPSVSLSKFLIKRDYLNIKMW